MGQKLHQVTVAHKLCWFVLSGKFKSTSCVALWSLSASRHSSGPHSSMPTSGNILVGNMALVGRLAFPRDGVLVVPNVQVGVPSVQDACHGHPSGESTTRAPARWLHWLWQRRPWQLWQLWQLQPATVLEQSLRQPLARPHPPHLGHPQSLPHKQQLRHQRLPNRLVHQSQAHMQILPLPPRDHSAGDVQPQARRQQMYPVVSRCLAWQVL
mmetsp:Transcript_68671/g.112725  ORF Transcript_68671/g.112725 Transcript_68671/m.112725 type:complete len:211 (-) Transcript_68671:402-1034(-)